VLFAPKKNLTLSGSKKRFELFRLKIFEPLWLKIEIWTFEVRVISPFLVQKGILNLLDEMILTNLFQKRVLSFFRLKNLSFFELRPILSFFEPKPEKNCPFLGSKKLKKLKTAQKNLKTAKKSSKRQKKAQKVWAYQPLHFNTLLLSYL
jgi:hypothetical protein